MVVGEWFYFNKIGNLKLVFIDMFMMAVICILVWVWAFMGDL